MKSRRAAPLALALLTLLGACPKREQGAAAPADAAPTQPLAPGPEANPAQPLDSAEPTLDNLQLDQADAELPGVGRIGGPAVRELHPLNPGTDHCLEMFSSCSGTPERCTSASLFLKCGESGSVPNSVETLKCVCP